MKLGIITDIHEHATLLRRALSLLAQHEVDQIVITGDIFETGKHLDETCELLADVNAIGVWGNHDFGLCVDPASDVREKFAERTLQFMWSLKPSLELEDCHFSHVEPWLNPNELFDLWYFEGEPGSAEQLRRIFDAVPHKVMFTGHNHRWLLATPNSRCEWDGSEPADLSDGRFFVVLGALCDGCCATLDTETMLLTPHHVGD